MADPTNEKALYAAVIALAWIAKELVMFAIKKKRNGSASGDLRPEEWDLRIGKVMREELENFFREDRRR